MLLKISTIFFQYILGLIVLPLILIIRLISPFIIIRFGRLNSGRIGHLVANTELYLCEIDHGINIPQKPFFDIFFSGDKIISNIYYYNKLKSNINIWPRWFMRPIFKINDLIPFGEKHKIGNNISKDRDVLNLFDKCSVHFQFNNEEKIKGNSVIKSMGISGKFVCLLVRDDAYLNSTYKSKDWTYHDYRNCDIKNYYLVSNELTKIGFHVIRMGSLAKDKFTTKNPKIIDYANSNFRSEFMDVYLGANCEFCISTSSGWDAIPYIFRKPIIFAPIVPVGYFFSFNERYWGITKDHVDIATNKKLTLTEIFERGAAYLMSSNEFIKKGIQLRENSPEEIKDLVFEFLKYKSNSKGQKKLEDVLEIKFKNLFATKLKGVTNEKLHGEINGRFGSKFLRNNLK